MSTFSPKLSVVVPVFNEEAVILGTHYRLMRMAEGLCQTGAVSGFEIVYVDDGSMDGTLALLRKICADCAQAKVLSFSRNFGHQAALAAGLLHAAGEVVVSLDADLQDPPELIAELIAKYREGYEIVYAARRGREADTRFKRGTARLFYTLMRWLGVELIYDHADYRLVSRKVVEEFRKMREINLFLRGLFPFMGFPHAVVYYDRQERGAGVTKYSLWKMLAFAWEGVTSFSSVPLKLASLAGFLVSAASLVLALWALGVKLAGWAIPGWASTVIPVFFIGGLNFLFLGVIGEYLAKIYAEVKKRPLYIVKSKYNF